MPKQIIWHSSNGEVISCNEKIKVMQQNLQELQQIARDAFEDGILMGIDAQQIKNCFADLMYNLIDPYTP